MGIGTDLSGLTALVTGGGRDLDQTYAQALAAAGTNLAGIARPTGADKA
jgi:NAD(P)-dependent dehydrogenase (short-subunit alcohol dehydrogenase family)